MSKRTEQNNIDMNKTIWFTGVGLACLPTLLCAKQNTPPNILFILCDDMGYGGMGW